MLHYVSNLTNCKRKKRVARARDILLLIIILNPKLLNQLSICLLNIYFQVQNDGICLHMYYLNYLIN